MYFYIVVSVYLLLDLVVIPIIMAKKTKSDVVTTLNKVKDEKIENNYLDIKVMKIFNTTNYNVPKFTIPYNCMEQLLDAGKITNEEFKKYVLDEK